MRLSAGAGREAQERKSIVRQCRAERTGRLLWTM